MSDYTDEDVQVALEAVADLGAYPWDMKVITRTVLDAVAPAIVARAKAEAVWDLSDRLERARDALNVRARDERSHTEQCRLDGKANGVALALSYVDEIIRANAREARS